MTALSTGLGEYSDKELLQELVERGVMEKIIGENREVHKAKRGSVSLEYVQERTKTFLRAEQRKRVEEILK